VLIATEVETSPAGVFYILTEDLGKWKVCAKWIPDVLYTDHCAILPLPISSVGTE
jgi:hypothetical protein